MKWTRKKYRKSAARAMANEIMAAAGEGREDVGADDMINALTEIWKEGMQRVNFIRKGVK